MPKGRDILGGLPWKTKAATPAYRSGWDEVFDGGRPRASRPDGKACAWCDSADMPADGGMCADCETMMYADAVASGPLVARPDGNPATDDWMGGNGDAEDGQHLPDQGPAGHDAPGDDGDLHDRGGDG